MYDRILLTLEATATDRAIIDHVKKLAKLTGSHIVLLHIATGVPARFHGKEAAGQEIAEDQAYLNQVKAEFEQAGISAQAELGFGDPPAEIIRWVQEKGCDLLAMSTHGHHFIADLVLGQTATRVRHEVSVPVLMLRAR
jgi:nucleotide-binding universal stress UspA family protein